MDIGSILISALIQFVIIYFAVRSAIGPLLDTPKETTEDNQNFELARLRDIEVLSDNELEEIIQMYKDKDAEKKEYENYQKHVKALGGLKEIGYFSEEEYSVKLEKLKEHFNVQ